MRCPAVTDTGAANVTICQPDAVSLVKVAVARRLPVAPQRVPVCVPVLAEPL